MFRSARSQFRLLKVSFASMSKMPWTSGFSNSFRTLSVFNIFDQDIIASFYLRFYLSMLRPMIRLRTSPTPMGITLGFLSSGIKRHALFMLWKVTVYFTAMSVTVRHSEVDDWLKLESQRPHSLTSTPEGTWLPCVFIAALRTTLFDFR